MTLRGRKVLVLGLGETGLSMARWLARRGATVRLADSRAQPPALAALRAELPDAEVRTGAFAEALLDGVDLVAISPGLSLREPIAREAARRGLEIVGDIELFARALPVGTKVLAVTGTNGKSTVTALTGALLKAASVDAEVAGNISPAALDALAAREDSGRLPEAWVLELSSFQLETTHSLNATAAAMLNLSEDHLDRYDGMADYAAAKARIFRGDGAQVLNRDDPASLRMKLPGRQVVTFGLEAAREREDFGLLNVSGDLLLAKGLTPLMPVRELGIAGLHNAANALAALALARTTGARCTDMLAALRSFRGLPHRMEHVADIGGVTFYDDSKGTNVGSTVAALHGLARELEARGGRVVLIAGGEGKSQDFMPLRDAVGTAVREVMLIGRDAPAIARVLEGAEVPVVRATSLGEAVDLAFHAARPGDVVLLSPACASFDMFRNYKHRGEMFRAAVQELAHARAH